MLDTSGKRIHAHGGGIFRAGDTYFLYGENKEKSVKGADIWHWGVRVYESADLYNWEDRGMIIPPDLEDIDSPLHPSSMMDRPHILFCAKTGKYVCWLKIMGRNNIQAFTVMQADAFLGPYEMVKKDYRPFGMSAGDFYLDVDKDNGKAILFFEKVHTHIVSCALSDDFLEVTEPYQMHLYRELPPDSREAPVHFVRNAKHYLFTSGTTGYMPNPSEAAVADNIIGPYRAMGNLHPSDESQTSFGCQISEVLNVPGTDLFIAIGDRWQPKIKNARSYLKRWKWGLGSFAKIYGLEKAQRLFSKERPMPNKRRKLKNYNTALADYVWLPVRFDGDRPIIEWLDEWRIEDFV
jgi:hypothetical protein